MEKKAAKELRAGQMHRFLLPSMRVVLVAKRHPGVVDLEDSVVRDRNAMGVAGQVLQDRSRAGEGRSHVNDPPLLAFLAKRAKKPTKGPGIFEIRDGSMKRELSRVKRGAETVEKLRTEDVCDDILGDEVVVSLRVFATRDPTTPIERDPASGNHPMYVQVIEHDLTPGVKDSEETDLCSERAGFGGGLLESVGGGRQ
jgi:hypothetical protein